jgi:hypothetical protein
MRHDPKGPIRQPISKRTRFEIFKRDKFTCAYCGRTPPTILLVVDHVVPVVEGGRSDLDNLITACEECNQGKGAVSLDQVPQSLADSITQRQERAEQLAEYNRILTRLRKRDEAECEELGRYWHNLHEPQEERDKWTFSPARMQTIKGFMRLLPKTEILEAMDIAHGRWQVYSRSSEDRCFRYFCGICWRKSRERGGRR